MARELVRAVEACDKDKNDDPGTPLATARELVRAVDEACDKGGSAKAGETPEVRLILHQLLWILYGTDVALHDVPPNCGCPIFREGKNGPGWDWDKDMAAVRATVEAEKAGETCTATG